MGWLKGIGRAIGRGVEKVGNFFGSEKISNLGRNIQERCTEKVATEKSYDKREANINTTDRLNEILISFSEGYFQHAKWIEKRSIELVEAYYDNLIDIIENAPDCVHSSANLKALKSGKSRIARTIDGRITNLLSKRMSLDDSECLKILKMDAGLEKKQAMTKFTNKVIQEALDALAKSVRISLGDRAEDIGAYVEEISEEQDRALQALKKQFDKMAKNDELEKSDKEKLCVQPLYVIEVTECIANILE